MLHAFIISLNSPEHPRNLALLARLGAGGVEASVVPGVVGRRLTAGEYFDHVEGYWRRRGMVMTPSEVGCSLSHNYVHRQIVARELPGAIVLEDDALLDAESLHLLKDVIRWKLHLDGVVLLGGQEGLEHLVQLAHGKPIDLQRGIWELMPEDLRHVLRSVGYVISAQDARLLVRFAEEGAFVMDDYSYVFEYAGVRKFFLANCIGHPVEIAHSFIETERAKVRWAAKSGGTPLWRRLINEIGQTVSGRRSAYEYRRRLQGFRKIEWTSRFSGSGK